MKNTIQILLALLLFFQSKYMHTQSLLEMHSNEINTLSFKNTNGKIKSIQQTAFKPIENNGVIQQGENAFQCTYTVNQDFFIQFDEKGRATKETYYCAPQKLETFGYHKYDEIKNTETVESVDAKGKIWNRTIYKYNSNGKLTEILFYHLSKEMTREHKIHIKLNEKGNPIETDQYDVNDKILFKSIHKYDIKDNLVADEFYYENGGLWGKETYKVDNNGNVITHDYYTIDCKGVEHSFIFKYDLNNNIIQKDYYKPENKLVTKYSYSYEYDSYKNWIKRIDFENGKATLIVVRELKYF